VEIGSFTLELSMKSLCDEVKWTSNQCAIVWYFDKRMGEDVGLVDEIQIVALFEMYKSEISRQVVVGVFDKSVRDEHEFDALEALCDSP
jgi:hypothetical protein